MVSSEHRPRIFILSSTLVPGGAEMVVKSLATGLPGLGFETEVLCLRERGKIGDDLAGLGVSVRSGLARGKFDLAALEMLKKIFVGHRDAVLLSLDHHDAIFLGAVASKLAGLRRKVLCVHSTGLWKKGSSFSWTDRLVLGSYDRLIALAESHARHLREIERIDGKKIVLINNGIDTGLFSPVLKEEERSRERERLGISPGETVVTIAAALRPEKNHRLFLEAVDLASARVDGLRFIIAGDGPEAGKLQELASDMKIRDRVIFLGYREDMQNVYRMSDIAVLCSYPVVETFPLAVLEAMSSGLPVISTAVGSVPEMIRDGEEGILVPSDDRNALADAIASLGTDPDLRNRLGRKAREKVVANYSLDRMIDGYGRMFESLFDQRKEGR